MSGRLHKPVMPLIEPNSNSIRSAIQLNLQNAIHTALLLMPEAFQEDALYQTIAGLSYSGSSSHTLRIIHSYTSFTSGQILE